MALKKIAFAMMIAGFSMVVSAQSSSFGWAPPKLIVAGSGVYAPPGLSSIMADSVRPGASDTSEEVPGIRADGIREAAASIGARLGLANKLHEIAKSLKKEEARFDKVYNFSTLALRGNSVSERAVVLPPVLLDGLDADSLPSEDEMRIADRTYKIHAKERLLPVDKKSGFPVMPNWRDYLVFAFNEVEMPHESLLPKTAGEKALWDKWVMSGWKEGLEQGQRMFDLGFARLDRDFHGMLKYRLAYSQGLITRPKVAGVNMGTTGGGNEMRLNDRVIRITDHSALVPDEKKWLTAKPD